jgi:hypothetical protein
MKRINQKGQSLIEAVIALGAATLIVSAMAVAVITAVNSADFGKNQSRATYYAQQGIEILTQKSLSDWTSFKDVNGSYMGDKCLGDDNKFIPIFNCPLSQPTNLPGPNAAGFFIRQTHLQGGLNTCTEGISGVVTVSWIDGKCKSHAYCHSVELDACFTNIDSVPKL